MCAMAFFKVDSVVRLLVDEYIMIPMVHGKNREKSRIMCLCFVLEKALQQFEKTRVLRFAADEAGDAALKRMLRRKKCQVPSDD